jgi:non-ribosomal peptide synthase protein (TIGR01720 family)
LLAALARALGSWASAPQVAIKLEGHGRETDLVDGVDLSRTVGWFTTAYPVVVPTQGPLGDHLRSVKTVLRDVPHAGLGYGLLRYGRDDAALACEPEVAFNYLGQFEGIVRGTHIAVSPADVGPLSSTLNRSPDRLAASAFVRNGELELRLWYDDGDLSPTDVAALLSDWVNELTAMVEHCGEGDARAMSPSDFELVRIDESTLAEILDRDS